MSMSRTTPPCAAVATGRQPAQPRRHPNRRGRRPGRRPQHAASTRASRLVDRRRAPPCVGPDPRVRQRGPGTRRRPAGSPAGCAPRRANAARRAHRRCARAPHERPRARPPPPPRRGRHRCVSTARDFPLPPMRDAPNRPGWTARPRRRDARGAGAARPVRRRAARRRAGAPYPPPPRGDQPRPQLARAPARGAARRAPAAGPSSSRAGGASRRGPANWSYRGPDPQQRTGSHPQDAARAGLAARRSTGARSG